MISLLLILLINMNLASAENKCFSGREIAKQCDSLKTKNLSNLYPAQGIFIGLDFNYHVNNLSFINELIKLSEEDSSFPNVNILLPKSYQFFKSLNQKQIEAKYDKRDAKTGHLYLELMKMIKGKRVNLIQVQDERTLWAQDLFELHHIGENLHLQNFRRKYNFDYKYVFEKQCKVKLQEEILTTSSIDLANRQYEDGGNFESLLGTAILGSSMPIEMRNHYKKSFRDVLELDVDWLSVGHVDEILQIIPSLNKEDCGDLAILYPSPKVAFKLLGQDKPKSIGSCYIDPSEPKSSAEAFAFRCPKFFKENKLLDERVYTEVRKVIKLIKKKKGCQKVRTIPLPELFFRNFNKPFKKYGLKQNRYRPLYPNLANSTNVNNYLLMPKQSVNKFQKYAEREIKKIGLEPRFLDVSFVDEDDGAVHCLMNVSRSCRNKTPPQEKRR